MKEQIKLHGTCELALWNIRLLESEIKVTKRTSEAWASNVLNTYPTVDLIAERKIEVTRKKIEELRNTYRKSMYELCKML